MRSLGCGAFKHAFLVEKGGGQFALKIASLSGDLRARFEREVAALQGCEHPAVARVVTSSQMTLHGIAYWVLVEEYLPSGTLSELVEKGPIPPNDIRHLGIILADAIGHFCERGFVHRDIKPANILFRSPREPVLTDFGLVRMLGEKSLTQEFMAQGPGTPMYASPEQLLNDKNSIDWRTDQFGLALVLAELLLGHHAYMSDDAGHVRDAISRVASRQPLPSPNRDRLLDLGFGCLVKALAPWPVERYRRPNDFLCAIKGV